MYKIFINIFILMLSVPAMQAQTFTLEELESWVKGAHDFGYLTKEGTTNTIPEKPSSTIKIPNDASTISNSWLTDMSINMGDNELTFRKMDKDDLSSYWKIIPNGDTGVKIQSVKNPEHYIHCEGGVLQVGPIQPNWLSAYWKLKPAHSGYNRIHSSWLTDQYLHCEAGNFGLGQIQPNWASALWVIK